MPASVVPEDTPLTLGEAMDQLRKLQAECAERERQARTLMIRASHQLSQWQWKYTRHNPDWPSPSGDIELTLDMDDWIAGSK